MDEGRETVEEERLVDPFSIAEYEATCPNGHQVTLSTGYSVFAPDWWKQGGTCQVCRRSVERTVGFRHGQVVAGPIHWHWRGEKTKEEEDWRHDVLNEHRCERCRQLAEKELARTLLTKIEEGAELTEIAELLKELTA